MGSIINDWSDFSIDEIDGKVVGYIDISIYKEFKTMASSVSLATPQPVQTPPNPAADNSIEKLMNAIRTRVVFVHPSDLGSKAILSNKICDCKEALRGLPDGHAFVRALRLYKTAIEAQLRFTNNDLVIQNYFQKLEDEVLEALRSA